MRPGARWRAIRLQVSRPGGPQIKLWRPACRRSLRRSPTNRPAPRPGFARRLASPSLSVGRRSRLAGASQVRRHQQGSIGLIRTRRAGRRLSAEEREERSKKSPGRTQKRRERRCVDPGLEPDARPSGSTPFLFAQGALSIVASEGRASRCPATHRHPARDAWVVPDPANPTASRLTCRQPPAAGCRAVPLEAPGPGRRCRRPRLAMAAARDHPHFCRRGSYPSRRIQRIIHGQFQADHTDPATSDMPSAWMSRTIDGQSCRRAAQASCPACRGGGTRRARPSGVRARPGHRGSFTEIGMGPAGRRTAGSAPMARRTGRRSTVCLAICTCNQFRFGRRRNALADSPRVVSLPVIVPAVPAAPPRDESAGSLARPRRVGPGCTTRRARGTAASCSRARPARGYSRERAGTSILLMVHPSWSIRRGGSSLPRCVIMGGSWFALSAGRRYAWRTRRRCSGSTRRSPRCGRCRRRARRGASSAGGPRSPGRRRDARRNRADVRRHASSPA